MDVTRRSCLYFYYSVFPRSLKMEGTSTESDSTSLEATDSDNHTDTRDGKRMQNLRYAMDKTIKSFISQLRYLLFDRLFVAFMGFAP